MLIQLLVKSSDRAVSTMPSIPPRAAGRHDTFGRLPEPATSSQTEVAQRPRGQRRLERRPAYFWSAELRRFPAKPRTSRRSKRPPAVLIGAGSAARFITGSAAAGIAGARPADVTQQSPRRSFERRAAA